VREFGQHKYEEQYFWESGTGGSFGQKDTLVHGEVKRGTKVTGLPKEDKEDHFDSEVTACTDIFVHSASKGTRMLPSDADEYGLEFAYGDKGSHVRDADCRVEGPPAIAAKVTPFGDDMVCKASAPGLTVPGNVEGPPEFLARDADSPDYSIHQVSVAADGRDKSIDDEDPGFAMRRSQAIAKQDHFNGAGTPSTATYVQEHRRCRFGLRHA